VSLFVLIKFGGVNVSTLKNGFEKIPNVKVLDIWAHGDFDEYASAIILIDNTKLLKFEYFDKNSFIDDKGIVRVSRIGDWDLGVSRYGFLNVYEIGGGPVNSYGSVSGLEFSEFKIFTKENGLNDIRKIQDVIKNYNSILEVINKIPEYPEDIKDWNKYILENMSGEEQKLVKYYDDGSDMVYWIKKTKGKPFLYIENMDVSDYR
jgi:TusA-related sulfurtransferase